MIAYEYMHYLHGKRKRKQGFMTIKPNMSKAYDRVECDFLAKVMGKMEFCSQWIGWVMKCISTVTYSFNINGNICGYIKPYRGIRQGDPLSPYLFLLCSEGLSSLLSQASINKEIFGISISRGS
ncbi:hypothetical protein ACH5RR_029522 [Cinchona calisaya]|uniref:Reverse transcriptase domain-containing protein n=1 Tax=Cinchona calisaya TaxID=153742 RepID=A0ABD2YTB6_9GENT